MLYHFWPLCSKNGLLVWIETSGLFLALLTLPVLSFGTSHNIPRPLHLQLLSITTKKTKKKTKIKKIRSQKISSFLEETQYPLYDYILSLKKPSTLFRIIFLICLLVSCDRIIIGGCTRSNCFTRDHVERNPCLDV